MFSLNAHRLGYSPLLTFLPVLPPHCLLIMPAYPLLDFVLNLLSSGFFPSVCKLKVYLSYTKTCLSDTMLPSSFILLNVPESTDSPPNSNIALPHLPFILQRTAMYLPPWASSTSDTAVHSLRVTRSTLWPP